MHYSHSVWWVFESSSRPWENRSVATKFWRKGRNTSIRTAPRRLYGGGGGFKGTQTHLPPKISFSSDFGHFILNDFPHWFLHRSSSLIRSPTPRSRWSCQMSTPPPHTHTDTKGNAALLRKGVDKKLTMGVDLIPGAFQHRSTRG